MFYFEESFIQEVVGAYMQTYSLSLQELFASPWRHRFLISSLVVRDIKGRYRGSIFGVLWSLITPLLMLGAYTFVFSIVFQAKWDVELENKAAFTLILFCGLLIFNYFAEMVNQAPVLILNNPAYVKKIVFPLDCLIWVGALTSLFNLTTSLVALVFVELLIDLHVNWTIIFFPLVLMPLMFFTMGVSWFLASLGVYLRDVSQIIGVITTLVLFMSPIFYPISAVPPKVQTVLMLNPLAPIIDQARRVVLWGQMPEWHILAAATAGALFFAWAGFAWFQKTRKGFADVL
jgi:lipopolysaccharide transport system permease protein